MPYKNPREFLTDATKYPAAIEDKLPEGAPKLSATLLDIAGRIPDLPNFIIELPDLPAPPEIPGVEVPGLRRYVTAAEVKEKEAVAPPAPRRARRRFLY